MNRAALVDIFNRPWLTKQGRTSGGKLPAFRAPETDTRVLSPADLSEADAHYGERIRALAAEGGGMVFQSVAVVAVRVLARVAWHERQVAEAAMSLGQRERLDKMIETLDATIGALRETLSPQGEQMLNLSQQHEKAIKTERYWWFALTEAIEALEEGADWLASVVSGQARGCAARTLSSVVVRLLHRHYYELLNEAEQWMGGNE